MSLGRLILDSFNRHQCTVQSRANAIRSGTPNAIYRQAEQAPGGRDSVFQDPNGFVTFTRQVYSSAHR